MQAREDITGLILAGGRGSRMAGSTRACRTIVACRWRCMLAETGAAGRPRDDQCQPQPGRVRVVRRAGMADPVDDFAGPLAGFLAGLEHCETR